MTTSDTPPMATPRVAAGALFFDEEGRVLLVKPAYKEGWDIPGGYVEPGESPRAACVREIQEELGLSATIGNHLVVDWAPAKNEGDKMLFVFDAGLLTEFESTQINFSDGELAEWRFVADSELESYMPARLSRRVHTAISAKRRGIPAYAEHGNE
ncbi:NUDIX hydrolase [Actinoplanes sp. NBRC 101535]|uniref:NUDIX domain-containing protein n=1 Tax=Actinoplanes sp. NBRC 101535 TaxID=3032196 RepID=UPI002554EB86|nr:NUDIX hydrolase [Actinoplanes sp. NBRC 101535]